MSDIEEIKKEVKSLPNRILDIVGVTTAVFLAFIISDHFGIIPDSIWDGAFLFLGLPFIFIFIFGVITNDPNFGVKTRWGLGAYFIVSFGFFLWRFGDPNSITSYMKLVIQYALAVIIVFISAIFYVIPEVYLVRRGVQYRWRAIFSFGLSVLATIGFILLLKRFEIIRLIT